MTKKRVLLLYSFADRPFLEMVADHLSRLEFDVVLDIEPVHRPTRVDNALKQIEFADRVVVAVSSRTQPEGPLIKCARAAQRQRKLVLVSLDGVLPPFGRVFPLADLSEWTGEADSTSFFQLIRWLWSDLQELPEPHQPDVLRAREMLYQSGPDEIEPPSVPLPAPIYVHQPDADPIKGRRAGLPMQSSFETRVMRVTNTDVEEDVPDFLRPRTSRTTLSSREIEELLSGRPPAEREVMGFGASKEERDPIEMYVFAPKRAKPGDRFLIHAWLYRPSQRRHVHQLILQADERAKERARRSIGTAHRGGEFRITLDADGLSASDAEHVEHWRGDPIAAQFIVAAPECGSPVQFMPTVRVSLDGVPLARHAITIRVDPKSQVERGRWKFAQPYKRAFLSYSSEDRQTVLLQAQALQAARVSVFQDVLNLAPGDRWEQKLYRMIGKSDLFLLFWSQKSARSEWVIREAEYALACQRNSRRRFPDIVPVILDGPPPAPPPASLKHIHFDDPLRCIISAYASR